MLEQTRRQASVFVYIVFGLLIVIFIYGINPGNKGDGGSGCGTTSNTVVRVDGSDANQSAFRVAYSARTGPSRQRTYYALDEVIKRELLAQAASDRGIRATGDLIQDEIMNDKRGYFYLGGERMDITGQFFEDIDGTMIYNRKRWIDWINQRNLQSPGSYLDEQARGLQAAMMAELITGGVRVSRDEALANYLYENNTVTYDVVGFEPAKYRTAMKLTPADIKRYVDEHTAEVQTRYQADKRTYTAVKPQLALREIFIPKAKPAADKPAADKPADDKAAKPIGLAVDAAKAKLEAVRAEIAGGKLTFPDAEKQLAADAAEDAPADNGDRGWQSIEAPSLGDKAVNDAVKTLKSGEMTPVIATDRGVYLVIATDKREGDLTFDQVKTEIGTGMAKDAWSKEAAKRAALEALASLEGGKTLEQLFERAPARPGGGGIEEILQNPNLTPEMKQKILEQLMQQQQKSGALDVREVDVPVAWHAADEGSSGSAAPAPAAGSAAPPAAGSAAPAAGSGAPPAAAPAAPPAPAPDVVASKDVLPQFDEVAKPKIEKFGPAPRQSKMQGVGGSKPAIDALFEELQAGGVAKKVYEGDGGHYVVVQLVARAQPNVADFDKKADEEINRMRDARGKAALNDWLRFRCEALKKSGRIRPAADLTRETDDKGNPTPTVYRPCMSLDFER